MASETCIFSKTYLIISPAKSFSSTILTLSFWPFASPLITSPFTTAAAALMAALAASLSAFDLDSLLVAPFSPSVLILVPDAVPGLLLGLGGALPLMSAAQVLSICLEPADALALGAFDFLPTRPPFIVARDDRKYFIFPETQDIPPIGRDAIHNEDYEYRAARLENIHQEYKKLHRLSNEN